MVVIVACPNLRRRCPVHPYSFNSTLFSFCFISFHFHFGFHWNFMHGFFLRIVISLNIVGCLTLSFGEAKSCAEPNFTMWDSKYVDFT